MMIRILKHSDGHPFFSLRPKRAIDSTNQSEASTPTEPDVTHSFDDLDVPEVSTLTMSNAHKNFCQACSFANLIPRPSFAKDNNENVTLFI